MNELDIFHANRRITDKIINDLRDLFHFFKRRNMNNCKIYIVLALEEFFGRIESEFLRISI